MPFPVRYLDVILAASFGVILRIAFWVVTGRVWEDALITIAHARNAVAGLGLTHHPGELPTHGFTSALSVLIPLVGEAISRDGGLVLLRLASLVAVVVTIVAADALGRRLGLERWPRLLVLGYLAVDANQIFYGMSGMETQVAVAALLVSAWVVTARSRMAGIAVGIALLARPDFVIWAGILVALLIRRDRRYLFRVGAGAIAVVAPWILFTTAYYGSPIPQTIIAKSVAFTTFPIDRSVAGWVAWFPQQIDTHISSIARTFTPFLEDTLAVRTPVPSLVLLSISAVVATLAVIGAIDRRHDAAWAPIIAFVAVFLTYRTLFLQPIYSDWYNPPFTAMTILLVAAGIQRSWERRPARSWAMAIPLVIAFAMPLPWVFSLERAIQIEIEDGVRVPTSDALGALVPPGEGVISESAGYIGYDSHVTLYDFPGLTSRTALEGVRSLPPGGRSLVALVDVLRPPWLVLRPGELEALRSLYPAAATMYEEVRRIGSARDEIERSGYAKATVDAEFVILHRVP